jgi:hypothetical protein
MSDNPKEDRMHDFETVLFDYGTAVAEASQIAIRMSVEIAVLRNANRDLREKLNRGGGSQRERIATACLAGILANSMHEGSSGTFDGCAYDSVMYADALIARLDKEAKP